MVLVGVQYIGKKKSHLDHLYGTGLIWEPGQIHNIQAAVAQKMAHHTDVYKITGPVGINIPPLPPGQEPQRGIGPYPETVPPPNVPVDNDDTFVMATTEEAPPLNAVPLPPLDNMGRDELMNFALQHYGEKLHHSMKEETMRHKIISLINERGR